MDNDARQPLSSEPGELEPLEPIEELSALEALPEPLLVSPEFAMWEGCYLNDALPCLFLDRDLKILRANDSFCRMFGCTPDLAGLHFTQFYASLFDNAKSAELMHSIESPATGFTWRGSVEKIGTTRLRNISKVWILPLHGSPEAPPGAYSAVYLDYTDEHRQMLQDLFASLLVAARQKDNDTGNHIERVNRYARALAQDLAAGSRVPPVELEFVESIGLVSALHDVGKIGTPDDILNKAKPLDAWEWDVMKQHTINGSYILSTYPNPMAKDIALRHHEHWDGTGYPHGLSQDLIPLSARIVAVADVYDALRMRRAYKAAYSHQQTVDNMAAESGTHFDPSLIERFLAIAGSFAEIFSEMVDP